MEEKKSDIDYTIMDGYELNIEYYCKTIEYYQNLIIIHKKNKPFFFEKRKVLEYNIELSEYERNLKQAYQKLEFELNLIEK